jgi:hypothetical protein
MTIKREDEHKEVERGLGSSMARSGTAARRDQEKNVEEHVSKEHDEPIGGKDDEGSSMARSPSGTRSTQGRAQREQEDAGEGEHHEVRGGRGIMHETVEADHVIGDGGKIGVKSAEGESDMASSKANRKEAMEPEREENEQAAMGRERSVPAKHVIGHGERETIAKHTI